MAKLKTTWKHIRRSPYQALLAIAITSLNFFVVGIFLYTALLSSSLLAYFDKKPQITAFFSDRMAADGVKALETKLRNTGKIAEMRFVSKEQALALYKEQNKSDPLLLEMVTADILPASLEIQASEAKYLAQIATILKEEPKIEEVVYQKDIIDILLQWTNTVRSVGVVLISFFTLLSILVMLTITGMKIVLRREEVEILKLVGATGNYIGVPFVVEGVVYGVIGGVVGWLFTYIILLYATPLFSTLLSVGSQEITLLLPFISTAMVAKTISVWPISLPLMLIILVMMTISGAILGIVGTLLALWRYVRT